MNKFYSFCEKYQIEIIIMIFLFPALIYVRELSGYRNPYFLIDYSTGFGGRKLLGQICNLWLPEYGVRKRHILPVYIVAHLFGMGFFTQICGTSMRKVKGMKEFWLLLFLLMFYLLFPYSFKGITQGIGNSIDIFLVDFSLVFCWLFIHKRGSLIYYLSTVLLLILACLTHHIFCCIYFPLFLSLFIYDIFNDGFDKKKTIIYGCYTLGVLALFCFIIFFSKMNISYETLITQLHQRTTTLYIDDDGVYFEYYATLGEHFPKYVFPNLKKNIFSFIVQPILLFPAFVFFVAPLANAARKTQLRIHKVMYSLMFLSQLLILPAFTMAIDYGRWCYAYFFCQFMQIWILVSAGDENICSMTNKVPVHWKWAKKHPFYLSVIIAVFILNISMSYVSDETRTVIPLSITDLF